MNSLLLDQSRKLARPIPSQLATMDQQIQKAQEVVDRLEHGAPAFGAATPTTATWRRNVMDWHPDQGGDSRLWLRRNAAYQLLVAWYEFNRAS